MFDMFRTGKIAKGISESLNFQPLKALLGAAVSTAQWQRLGLMLGDIFYLEGFSEYAALHDFLSSK